MVFCNLLIQKLPELI